MTPVVVEQLVAAPPAQVYGFLVEPGRLAQWLGSDCTLEPEPNGAFEMLSPNGMKASGEVVELVQGRSISFTWGWQGHSGVPPGSTLVLIELIPHGDGTLVRLTHSGLAQGEGPLHETGWRHYLTRLSIAAAGGDPGPDPGAG